jgi:23S rRNA (uracil747-C5)-methyltransferase
MNCQWFLSHHCRSCELLDQSYENTLRSKEEKLKSLFPGVDLHEMKTVGLENPAAESRNKAKLAVFTDTGGLIRFGFYDSAGSPKVLEECPLHMKELNNLLPILKEKLTQYKIIPYSLKDKKGELKYVILSKSASHGEILLRFIVRSKESLDRLRIMTKILQEEIPLIKVATVNIQPDHKAVLEGDAEIVITPESVIENKFGDVHLNLGPRSFFQVTPEIAGKLYSCAGEIIGDYKIKSFLDLFCGVGAFSYFAAKHCPKVLGVEISKEAIDCALSSKGLNKIQGELDFKALDVEEFLKSSKEAFEGILVNPPRRGLNNSIIESILSQKPNFIIYSSCNSETLARDYEELKRDYKITRTQIFDMFPFTTHFETLMVFSRKDF